MTLREKLARRWRRDFGENVTMALATLRAHKLRSGLTVLGVIIAVTTLVAVVAILMGLDRNVQQSIQSFGVNTAFFHHLNPGPRFGRLSREERLRKPLSYEDYLAVREGCTACQNATVSIYTNQLDRVRYKSEEIVGLDFRGATAEFFSVYANAILKHGRPFTPVEDLHRVEVVVIGEDVAKGLFGELDPLGKQVVLNGHSFTVLGVLERPKGSGGGPGGNEDRRAVIPYWTFRKVYPQKDVHGIRIEAFPGQLPRAIDQVRTILRRQRRVPYDQPDNFGYSTVDSIIREFHNIMGIVALVTTVLSSVGLLVGGVGVMNIMLVSVTERTREIGVRKAIGARRRDIVWQFLSEAMALTGAGGLVGVGIGFLVSAVVRHAVPSLPTFVPLWAVVAAVMVAASVGLFFGIYPAVKAARLDPVEALRYE